MVNITTTITNTGQTPYIGISVDLQRRHVLDDARPPTAGTRPPAPARLSVGTDGAVWTGDIPVGGTVTITGSVIVNNPYTGNKVMTITDVHHRAGQQLPGREHRPAVHDRRSTC